MVINYTTNERDTLARIMRAEALAEGDLGMLMVGNVVVNRALANCYIFKGISTINDAIYQNGQFVGTTSSLFQASPTKLEKNLADRALKGEYYYPATNSLWFYAPAKNQACKGVWYSQPLAGRYKGHCFYEPNPGECEEIYSK